MEKPIEIGIVGLGRMGSVHAQHLLELERETGACRLAALVDINVENTRRFAAESGCTAKQFASIEDYVASGAASATMIVSPTDRHRDHSSALIRAGHRVILEKPLTGTLAGDIAFCGELDRDHPDSVMLAFQRRFDPALQYGRELMQSGAIGRVFKIYSALEDSAPPPNGYKSEGILPDMGVHNVDEILWLSGRLPDRALAVGSRIHGHALTTCKEDFDDALLFMWFGDDLVAQVQVSRNHVSGYRVETAIFGEQGHIQIGHFDQRTDQILVEAFGRRGHEEPIARRSFPGGNAAPGAPEFVDRFAPAYKAEVAEFIECCRRKGPFPMSHRDGLRAQQVIAAGMRGALTRDNAVAV